MKNKDLDLLRKEVSELLNKETPREAQVSFERMYPEHAHLFTLILRDMDQHGNEYSDSLIADLKHEMYCEPSDSHYAFCVGPE
jgi:hypothetical protein